MADADSTCACLVCGRAIKRKVKANGGPSSRVARYCGAACKVKARRDRLREAGTPLSQQPRFRGASCKLCGKSFQSRPSGKSRTGWTEYCSGVCGQRGRHLCDGTSSALKPVVVQTYHGHCKLCGKHFKKGRHDTLYCSDACSRSRYAWVPHERPCRACRASFVQQERRQVACSPECKAELLRKQRRVAKSQRRARVRGAEHEAIDPIAVFERDRWRCQLCKARTPKRLRGTYEVRAPELDHIVALADGGAHTWGNVQCACRECNGAKGAASRGQLGLPFAA